MLIVKSKYNWVWYLGVFIFLFFNCGSLYAIYIQISRNKADWRMISILAIIFILINFFKITEVFENKIVLRTLFSTKVIKYNKITLIEKYRSRYPVASGYELSIEYGKNSSEIIPLGYYSNFKLVRDQILHYYHQNTGADIEHFT